MSKTHNIEDWGKEIMFSRDVDWMISVEDNSLTYPKPHQLSEKIKQTLEDFSTHIKKEREEELMEEFVAQKNRFEMELDAVSLKSIEDFVLWSDNRKQKDLSTPEANKATIKELEV